MTDDSNNENVAELENTELPGPMPSSLKTGIWVLAITVACVAGALITGYPTCCLFGLVTGIALPLGGIAVVLGLFQKSNRTRPRLWHNLATLTAIAALLYLLTLGPCYPIGLLNLRMRGLVALTGGEEKLKAWAMEVLARADESMNEHDSDRRVSREEWSAQVRWLRPKHVNVQQDFQNDMKLVYLCYGGGFCHWNIVIGPPGFVREFKPNGPSSDSTWIRWRDGVYCWFPD